MLVIIFSHHLIIVVTNIISFYGHGTLTFTLTRQHLISCSFWTSQKDHKPKIEINENRTKWEAAALAEHDLLTWLCTFNKVFYQSWKVIGRGLRDFMLLRWWNVFLLKDKCSKTCMWIILTKTTNLHKTQTQK